MKFHPTLVSISISFFVASGIGAAFSDWSYAAGMGLFGTAALIAAVALRIG